MDQPRYSGLLLHVTSLPGRFGIGDFGPTAYQFVDFLQRTHQTRWQVLPLGPTGYGDSPYQSFSAFAGNPLLISLEELVSDGLLPAESLADVPAFPQDYVDYGQVGQYHEEQLRRSFEHFQQHRASAVSDEFATFTAQNHWWLEDFALFMALKRRQELRAWTEFPERLRRREPQALAETTQELAWEVEFEKYVQHQFVRQWFRLKQYANERRVEIVGDIPIFVAHDSADVWTHPDLFYLEPSGQPRLKAGVPPDLFSEDGQLWGNPLYNWEVLAATDYAWWVQRLDAARRRFDHIRVDHFRGFEAYWEVPGDAPNARFGRWAAGPGAEFFRRVEAQLGRLPLIAEDLGVITPAVDAMREELGYPGMRVLQFAFGGDPRSRSYQPHRYERNCVAYTGTHDNDTSYGWMHSPLPSTTESAGSITAQREYARRYLATHGDEIHWDFLRAVFGSVAEVAIVPMQDVLGLDSQARMNYPSRHNGNWRWRMTAEQLTTDVESRLREVAELYERGT